MKYTYKLILTNELVNHHSYLNSEVGRFIIYLLHVYIFQASSMAIKTIRKSIDKINTIAMKAILKEINSVQY